MKSALRFSVPCLWVLSVLGAARAAEWTAYDNARFGYSIEIPPGFSEVAEAENGDGGTSRSDDGKAQLSVWGGYLTEGDFSQEMKWRIDQDINDGWKVSYRKQQPSWASWSGAKGDRIFYERAIAACDGAAAYFRLEYDATQMKSYDEVVPRLVKSLQRQGC